MDENNQNQPDTTKTIKNVLDDDKNTDLHFAASAGEKQNVIDHIERGDKIDAENYLGWTPLMMAARRGHLRVVEYLLEKRADATRKNKYGFSVFLVSVASGNLDIIYLLLQHLLRGGVSRQSMEIPLSPLSLSILFNHMHVLRYLLENSFNVNSSTSITGLTPLMFATAMSNCKAYGILLTKTPCLDAKNFNGQTAEDIACTKKGKVEPKSRTGIQPSLMPVMVMGPQTQLYPCLPHRMSRKSSDLRSPSCYFPPVSTPITPIVGYLPQIFFPQDFAISPVVSPVDNVVFTNDALNIRLNQNSYISPISGQASNCRTPNNYSLHLPNNEKVLAWFNDMANNRTPIL